MSASAAFSILTQNPEVCQRIIDEISSWVDLLKEICASENPEVQRRCMQGVANMVASSEKVAAEIMRTDVFHVLVAIVKHSQKGREEAQKEAKRALEAAIRFEVIAPTKRQMFEDTHKVSTIKE
uniref:CLASP_N domain-containing protein n=1 Tax=Steinernema glaseri TaxID=37863 RepID=A0A1I7ZEB3_9BILA